MFKKLLVWLIIGSCSLPIALSARTCPRYASEFYRAIEDGDVAAVKLALRENWNEDFDVNYTKANTPTPLVRAIESNKNTMKSIPSGKFNMVELLVNYGADVNLACYGGGPQPLGAVANSLDIIGFDQQPLTIAQLLLNHGADIHSRCGGGKYPLDSALENYRSLMAAARGNTERPEYIQALICARFIHLLIENGCSTEEIGIADDDDPDTLEEVMNLEFDEDPPVLLASDVPAFDLLDVDTLASEESVAYCVNDQGIVCGSFLMGNKRQFFLWSKSRGIELIRLPKTAEPVRLNDHNQIAGNYSWGNLSRGFFWSSEGGFIDIGTLGGRETTVFDLNNLGQIVGQSEKSTRSTVDRRQRMKHAFIWEIISSRRPTMTDLGTLPGSLGLFGEESLAASVNDEGLIVGSSNKFISDQGTMSLTPLQAVIWRNQNIENLFDPDYQTSSVALSINNRGDILIEKEGRLSLWRHDISQRIDYPFDNVIHGILSDDDSVILNHNTLFKASLGPQQCLSSRVVLSEVLTNDNNSEGLWTDVMSFNDINSQGDIAAKGVSEELEHALYLKAAQRPQN